MPAPDIVEYLAAMLQRARVEPALRRGLLSRAAYFIHRLSAADRRRLVCTLDRRYYSSGDIDRLREQGGWMSRPLDVPCCPPWPAQADGEPIIRRRQIR